MFLPAYVIMSQEGSLSMMLLLVSGPMLFPGDLCPGGFCPLSRTGMSLCRHPCTVDERAVRILLECFLVLFVMRYMETILFGVIRP